MGNGGPSGSSGTTGTTGQNFVSLIRSIMPSLLTDEIRDLIDKAVRRSWTIDEFLGHVYSSETFIDTFPGIFRADGTLKMNAAEYLQAFDQYASLAQSAGIKIDKKIFGNLIAGDTSYAEFNDRVSAVESVIDNKVYLDAFRDTLRSMGISVKGMETPQDYADFVMGRSTKRFYNLYEELQVRGAAGMAGLTNLGERTVNKIVGAVESKDMSPAELEEHFKSLANKIRTVLPASQLAGLGISKKDLVTLEFGGANRDAIEDRVTQAISNYEGYFQQRGQAQTATGQRQKSMLYGETA
jgi:hypothetical protein